MTVANGLVFAAVDWRKVAEVARTRALGTDKYTAVLKSGVEPQSLGYDKEFELGEIWEDPASKFSTAVI